MSNVSKVVVVQPPAEVDVSNAHSFAADLTRAVDTEPDVLVVDCGGVTFMDSSAVDVIRYAQRAVERRGGRLTIRNASSQIRLMLDLAAEDDGAQG